MTVLDIAGIVTFKKCIFFNIFFIINLKIYKNRYSRNGKELSVLPQLFKSLPENLFLDGELW